MRIPEWLQRLRKGENLKDVQWNNQSAEPTQSYTRGVREIELEYLTKLDDGALADYMTITLGEAKYTEEKIYQIEGGVAAATNWKIIAIRREMEKRKFPEKYPYMIERFNLTK